MLISPWPHDECAEPGTRRPQGAVVASRPTGGQLAICPSLALKLRSQFASELQSEAELVGHLALLGLLEALNDAQVIILIAYGSFHQVVGNRDLADFYTKHPSVLGVQPPTMNSSEEERRAWAIRRHYDDELVARGLLEDTEGIAKSPTKQLRITPLGRLLLEAIGQRVVD